jgi:hypothetical protein
MTQGGLDEDALWPRLDLDRGTTVRYIYLLPSADSATLTLYPGDTLEQARCLFADSSRADALLRLRQQGWTVEPNMHFGFAERGYAWLHTKTDVERYINYWLAAITRTNELKRVEWPGFMAELQSRDIAGHDDEAAFDSAFTDTARTKASPRPGLRLAKKLTAPLGDIDGIGAEVCQAITVALDALREPAPTLRRY